MCFRGKEGFDQQIDHLFHQAIVDHVFPGAVLAVYDGQRYEQGPWVKAYGKTGYLAKDLSVSNETIYDLASLTKPLVTALSVFHLLAMGQLKVDDRLVGYLPSFKGKGKEAVTIRQLLSHSSGLPAWCPYYQQFSPEVTIDAAQALKRQVLVTPLTYEPGTRCQYSDLGFMALGWLIEAVTEQGLDQYYRQIITAPLGLTSSLFFQRFNTAQNRWPGGNEIAPTENCLWRNRRLLGEVHDEHCWLLSGVSGHAGLFGTAEAVMDIIIPLLLVLRGNNSFFSYLNKELLVLLKKQYQQQTWCAGFDTPSATGSSAGQYFSPYSIGHLGYTGTSFWVDPVADLVVVLLSNRVHPSRDNEEIRRFRPQLHDLIQQLVR